MKNKRIGLTTTQIEWILNTLNYHVEELEEYKKKNDFGGLTEVMIEQRKSLVKLLEEKL